MAVMNWMRRTSRYFLAAVVLTFIASLAYFGATQDRGAETWVVRVNGAPISAAAYQRTYRAAVEQVRQTFGARFNDDLVRTLHLQDRVIERLVLEELIGQRAAAEGITVSDRELSDQITRIAAFQDNGAFSRDRYLRLLVASQLTPAEFERDFRAELLRQKLQLLVASGVKVSTAEARARWEGEQQRVKVAYLFVAAASAPENAPVTDAELDAYYKAHPAEFTQPERRRVLMALLPGSSVSPPAVTDAEVEEAYKARRTEFEQPTRVHVAHIVVRVPTVGGSQAEDAAKAKATAAAQRIRAGADFVTVAREVSEDPATAARGGDLGIVAPGELTPELDRVVFGLKKGEIAGPIRTPFGWDVVKAVDVLPASKKELKDVAPTLRATLAAEGQLRALQAKAQDVREALLVAADFAAEATKRGLAVREVGPLRRSDPVEGVGRVAEASDAIFGLAPDGVSAPVKVPEGYAIFRLVAREPARLPPLTEIRGDVARAVRRQKGQEAARQKAGELADALRKGEDPRTLAKQTGAAYGELGPLSRAELPAAAGPAQALGPAALALPNGAVGGPVSAASGFYALKVIEREHPNPADFDKARSALEARLLQDKRGQLWEAWLTALRTPAKVEVNRKVLPEA